MPLSSPNLDDRDFKQLVEEARLRIKQTCPEWTDLSPSDPGMVLLEVFAHLTEVMIYRLNRLPEKAYIEFLRLMGVQLQPPAAARVLLRFSLSRALGRPVEVPRGSRVTVSRSGGAAEAPTFSTGEPLTIPPGTTQADVLAYHCDLVQGELAGTATGLPGLSISARRPPIVARTGDGLDLVVGVEVTPGEQTGRIRSWEWEGKAYRLWREVDSFTELGPDDFVYVADRSTGTITFAPALQLVREEQLGERKALAQKPAAGRAILLWYRRGGGPTGNVAANTLTVLKDPISGVQVTNPEPATGGLAAETLENALLRGPQELHAPHRAVTAADFERMAIVGGVARARAFTKKALWAHATPGTVEVQIVPQVPLELRAPDGRTSLAQLREFQAEPVRLAIEKALDERRPLGTTCLVNWVRYQVVRVQARVVVFRGEDKNAVRARVLTRLHQTINPLPTALHAGWGFGQALRASHLYDTVLQEPGVSYLDDARFLVEEVPSKGVLSLAADAFQPRTWYSCTGDMLFRSSNNGDGWEPAGRFPDEQAALVRTLPGRPDRPHEGRPGLVAVATHLAGDQDRCRVHVSWDCGETWDPPWAQTKFNVADMVWMLRDEVPVLLLATDVGLYELRRGAAPIQILVDPEDQDRGFYAVAASTDVRGAVSVALAAQKMAGVWLSSQGGKPKTFTHIGLRGEDVRGLEVQYDGPRAFLWAAAYAEMEKPGSGCFRWELTGTTASPEGWRPFAKNWKGGSCLALAFQGARVLAASHRTGVLRLDSGGKDPAWEAPDFATCGLPLRDEGRLLPVEAVAADSSGRLLMAGGPAGVFRSQNGGVSYEPCSRKEFTDRVTIPETWLFCSGEHEVEVISEEEKA